MEINLSRQQFETLLKTVYLGVWMINAHREPEIRSVSSKSLSGICGPWLIGQVSRTSLKLIRHCIKFSPHTSLPTHCIPSSTSMMMRRSGMAW